MKNKIILICSMLLLAAGLLTGCQLNEYGGKESVIDDNYRTYYEVFVYSFCDSNGDGVGDIPGLTSKLDYIEDMGFNGIWLMPIMPSTTYHKYDVVDYYDIDTQYGTLDDFKKFMDECNKRNIKVIIDLVFNHTSSQNPWFLEACNYFKTLKPGEMPDESVCPYVNYYHFEENSDKSSFYNITGTDWYYEGMFWSEMPDLNLDNPKVRKEIEEISVYWMNLGVGGFRLDAAKEYFSGNSDKNIEVLTWYTDFIKGQNPDAYLVAEVWDSFDVIAKYYQTGIDSIFNYVFGNRDGQIVKFVNQGGNGSSGSKIAQNMVIVQNKFLESNPNMIDAPFLSNHDTGRIAGFVGKDPGKVKLAGALNVLMSGSAFVYYGEELGMSGAGRDENKRAPMYWTEDGGKGTTAPPPNMENTVKHAFGSLKEQKKDKESIYNYYKNLIGIRNQYPEIARGLVEQMKSVEDGDICAISKTWEGNTLYLLFNDSDERKEIIVPQAEYKYSELAEQLIVGAEKAELKEETLTIPAYGVVILK